MRKQYFITIIICLFISSAYAQFSVSAVATDENCPGTGSLSLSVQNANPSVPVNYKVYLLPESNVPFWNSSNPIVEGLQDGDYLIKASQVNNGSTTTAQTTASIGSNYVPLAFSVSSVNAVCGNDGSMVINVFQGSPATYEILDGPAIAGPQTSNVFNGLPAGTYEIRVTDTCGNGFISTQTFYVEQPVLTLTGPNFSGGTLSSCSQITVGCTVNAQGEGLGIIYPLSAQITVYPPSGGTPTVYNQSISSGPQNGLEILQQIQFYSASHTIDFKVTDPCGTVYTLNGSVVSQQMTAQGSPQSVLCNNLILNISAENYMPPYTINFTSTPAGFSPSAANSAYPGPFNNVATFGNEENPVPLGSYEFTITDACGRTASAQTQINTPIVPVPTVTATNSDCVNFLGSMTVQVTNHPLQTATITSAPAAYQYNTPYNVTQMISNGILSVGGLPIGNYTLNLTDVCGNTYQNVTAVVPDYSPQAPQFVPRADCETGKGALLILSNLTSVIITDAPAGFEHSLPYNASYNIANGVFSMDGFAGGAYTFKTTTACTGEMETIIEIPEMEVTENEISIGGDCVSFDLEINYESNAGTLVTFWLQSYNDDDNKWVHPETGAVYEEGDVLNNENAVPLLNNAINEALPYLGTFRVMKMQRSYGNGGEGVTSKICMENVYDFFFYNELDIRGVYNLTCVGELIDVQVDAIGVSPLHFEIISQNGDTSFYIDNGGDNIFTGLQEGLYHVRVTDPCGGFRVQQFNVSELPPLVSTSQPGDLGSCDLTGTGTSEFDLSTQDDIITNNLDDEIAAVTYHASLAEAENGVNPLPVLYTSGSAEIFARVEWVMNPSCYGIASFNLLVTSPTPLVMDDVWGICQGESVTVVADPGYVSYSWSNGATTQNIEVSEPGSYTCSVVSITGCEMSKTIEVVPVLPPQITRIDTDDFRDDENIVTVVMENTPNLNLYEYSIDGVNYQAGNTFTGIPAGQYTVTVRDRFGCSASDSKDIHLLTYPKFFTPNGDGAHDKWRIEYAILEPGMKVFIYDRYGKPITSFGATSEGWDGTLEGQMLPSTDYWFIVKRQDGREYRGHFAMMR